MSDISRGVAKLIDDGPVAFVRAVIRSLKNRYYRQLSYYWHRSALSGTSSPRLERNQSDSDREYYLRAVLRRGSRILNEIQIIRLFLSTSQNHRGKLTYGS